MALRLALLLAALASPMAAQAQARPQVSSDQLICDLSGQCGAAAQGPTQDKPDTRGFSIARAGGAGNAAASHVAAPSMSAAEPVASRHVAHMTRTSARPEVGRTVHHLAPRGPVGHSDIKIDFASGAATLTSQGKETADQFYTALQSPVLSAKRFLIAGHTSSVGSRSFNLTLSEKRAQAVVDYLVARGASRAQFDVKGVGFDQPLPGTRPSAPANRRVEVVVQN